MERVYSNISLWISEETNSVMLISMSEVYKGDSNVKNIRKKEKQRIGQLEKFHYDEI